MAAIVRVKRPQSESPADQLLVLCKRRKINDVAAATKSQEAKDKRELFQFAGTINEKTGDVVAPVKDAIRKKKIARAYQDHKFGPGYKEKSRNVNKKATADARFKVVSEKRAAELDKLNQEFSGNHCLEASNDVFLLYDIEKNEDVPSQNVVTCNSIPMEKEVVESDFVYDVYYTNSSALDYQNLESILTLEMLREENEFSYQQESDGEAQNSSDSNDENNWRNDYPDEDPDAIQQRRSGCDELSRFERLVIGGDSEEDLSDDDDIDLYAEDDTISDIPGQRSYDKCERNIFRTVMADLDDL